MSVIEGKYKFPSGKAGRVILVEMKGQRQKVCEVKVNNGGLMSPERTSGDVLRAGCP